MWTIECYFAVVWHRVEPRVTAALAAYKGDRENDKAVFNAVVAPLAEELGMPFTFDEAVEHAAEGVELTREDMDAVAGGTSFCILIGGSDNEYCEQCEEESYGDNDCQYLGIGMFYTSTYGD